MNNIYVEIKEKCCSQCYAECDGCWLEELITDRLAEERKKVCDQLKDYITRHYLKSIRGSGDIFLELDLTDLNTIFEIIEDGKYENFIPN